MPDPASTTPTPDEANPASMPVDPNEPPPPALPPQSDAGATNALSRLLARSPFTDLHERAGGDNHWIRAWVCFCTDYLMRLIIVGLILFIIAAVVWKTLAPFPDFWQSEAGSHS